MSDPGSVSLKCASWNIAGKLELFKLVALQTFLDKFDVICLTETHAIKTGTVQFPKFKPYEYPDTNCNYEYPRGGTCVLIKQEKRKFIKSVKKLMTDFVEIIFTNDLHLINLYIPPLDSPYYDEQYVELLCSWYVEAEETNSPVLAMGDLNARLGDLNLIDDTHTYDTNEDKAMNENGRHIKELLFTTSTALPLNHLEKEDTFYDGGFTFQRNKDRKSQIDLKCTAYHL